MKSSNISKNNMFKLNPITLKINPLVVKDHQVQSPLNNSFKQKEFS
jgi:hypothetical protein